jgi:uncharacterized protein YkwD
VPLYAAGLFAGAGVGLGIAAFAVSPGDYAEPAAVTPIVSEVDLRAIGIPAVVVAEPQPALSGAPAVRLIVEGPPAGLLLPGDPRLASMRVEPDAPVAPIVAEAPAPAQPAAPPAPAASLPQVQPPPSTIDAEPEAPPAVQPGPDAPPAKPNFYVPEVSHGGLNNLEQRLLDGLNAERVAAGMAPLTLEPGLTIIARTRSQQLVDQGYFGHKDPYGYSMYVELLALNGYTSYAWAGENLAMNNHGDEESPERAMVLLMSSPTHRRNILATEFSRIGVGLATMDDGRKYYTMIFLS